MSSVANSSAAARQPGVLLHAAEMKLLRELIYRECGMHFDEHRAHFLQDRVQRRLRACGMDSAYKYYCLVSSDSGRSELAALVELLAVNETSFFRYQPQLELFYKGTLRDLLRRKEQQHDAALRIWSAGCSTGQEPYSVAMLVCDALNSVQMLKPQPGDHLRTNPLLPSTWRVEILASDISYAALRAAQEGAYTDAQIEPVECLRRLRYFDRIGDRYVAKPALKELVHFDLHNLKSAFLPRDNDVIFCRNVMIYFDEAEQKRLIEKLYRCLKPQGYLFLGHTENLLGLSERFQLIHENSAIAYQRIEVRP